MSEMMLDLSGFDAGRLNLHRLDTGLPGQPGLDGIHALRRRGDLLDDLGGPQLPERIPLHVLEPVLIDPSRAEIVDGEVVLVPNRDRGTVWAGPTEVRLVDFSLTVRREQRADGSIAVTGGSALLTISATSPARVVKQMRVQRLPWDEQVLPALTLRPDWGFRPEPRYGLTVAVELPPGTASSEPLVVTSPMDAAATIAIELTESAALAWRSALEQGAGSTVPGALRVRASVPVLNGNDLTSLSERERSLDTAIGTLLAGRGPADLRQIDPQVSVHAQIAMVPSQMVQTSSVSLRPDGGQPAVGGELGPGGGTVETTIATTQPADTAVDWSAQVAFRPVGWPLIPAAGRLDPSNGWTALVKPDAWCVTYMIVVIAVDAAGKAVAAAPGDRAQGVLNFTAPYLTGGLLSSAFEAPYLTPVSVTLPRFPDRPFGDLVLSAFATRGVAGGTASRRLGESEVVVTVTVRPDGTLAILTASDPIGEDSAASRTLDVLTRLAGR